MRASLAAALLLAAGAALPADGNGGSKAASTPKSPEATLTMVPVKESLKCSVPPGYTDMQLDELQTRSCGKVNMASQELQSRGVKLWGDRIERAQARCAMALRLADDNMAESAAYQAINAWGTDMMDGAQCCTLLHPPFCRDMEYSYSTICIAVLLGIFVIMFGGAFVASCLVRNVKMEPQGPEQPEVKAALSTISPVTSERKVPSMLQPELQRLWLEGSCLRVLPGAPQIARATSSLFSTLHDRFDFQADNVRNQFEHLLSLWRSHCSLIADRSVEDGVQVDESNLLVKALGELHMELLEGFLGWRQKLRDCTEAGVNRKVQGLPSLGGVQWNFDDLVFLATEEFPTTDPKTLPRELAEITAFLLVWGEAGNIRFMPEVIYFITELVLSADHPGPAGLYCAKNRLASVRNKIATMTGQAYRSGMFLCKVIRPIYHVIFDEWYDYVDIDAKSRKDKKKLQHDYDRFLPADVANYDDWCEFFCEPSRLVEGLLLEDGTRLFEAPHGQRYIQLSRMDWVVSLDRYETKTHREVHSLWAVWASTHRVWLLHLVLFLLGICLVTGNPPPNSVKTGVPLAGSTAPVRFAIVGLTVPLHSLLWSFARWETSSQTQLRRNCGSVGVCTVLGWGILWLLPLPTYAAVRYAEATQTRIAGFLGMNQCLAAHFIVSAIGLAFQLVVPAYKPDRLWSLTYVPWRMRAIRYIFWIVVLGLKFLLGLTIFQSLFETMMNIGLPVIGHQSVTDIANMYYSATWGAKFLEWCMLWGTTFFLFLADTQMWFVVGCTFLGVATVLGQRRCMVKNFCSEDAISKIPELLSLKVFTYSPAAVVDKNTAQFSPFFPLIWDRIAEFIRYEDKCDNQGMGDMSFAAGAGTDEPERKFVAWNHLSMPLRRRRANNSPSLSLSGEASPGKKRKVKVPELFRPKSWVERGCKHYCCVPEPSWPRNPELQWRLTALARSLGLPIARPFRAPYIPGITVLIPHYGESIIMEKDELYSGKEEEEGRVPLMDWLQTQFEDEFRAFTSRMQASMQSGWAVASSQWEEYEDHQWEKICTWASMRMQTLWRTVAGMTLYHSAIQAHFEAQADRTSSLAQEGVWNPCDLFTCMVSMQMYSFFNAVQLKQANKLLEKFPDSLKIAFIGHSNRSENTCVDGMHPRQRRRYFSCLIDRTCKCGPDGRRVPRLRVELPGYPVLGDGKGDNQNHAIPFMRGIFAQCIDSNQGAYFEQMLLLPCVLGEFRTRYRGDSRSKQIIGLPEHITSDIGSIGDFAAGSEMAFGTILQRSYAVLGARMHYGHPDIMNKQFMMQQGGVSKATKTLNLSEDIFAGMDFTLRGQGRTINHCEYFHLAKGRDLGFNSVLVFFSKLSSGAGEQILTRQMFRLGQILHLPEVLSFYYAHVGYYLTQFFVSWSMPLVVLTWLLVLTADCEESFKAFQNCSDVSAAQAMAKTLSVWYSYMLFFFLLTTSMPLFFEAWMQRSFSYAVIRTLKQYGTGSFLHFIFQAKIIGSYVMDELRYGGATYMPTGRGLPTERRPFIGQLAKGSNWSLEKVGGLYLDYCMHTFYAGTALLLGAVLVYFAGGTSNAGIYGGWNLAFTWISIALTIISWLFAPFLFNPYQFSLRYFKNDVLTWYSFFFSEYGQHWIEWYDRQLQRRIGFRHTVIDINFVLATFFLTVWFATMNNKLSLLQKIYISEVDSIDTVHVLSLIPPVGASLLYCCLLTCAEVCVGCSSKVARALHHGHAKLQHAIAAGAAKGRRFRVATEENDSEDTEGESAAEDDEVADFTRHGLDHEVRSEVRSDSETDVESGISPGRFCQNGIPLIVSSVIVSSLQLTEAILPVYVLHSHTFDKAFIAGLVLKLSLYQVVTVLMEGVLRSRCFNKLGQCQQPLELWVHANRMAQDFRTSLFLLCLLTPFVLLNSLNEYLCGGCSLHQFLIYRDPGHLARKEAFVADFIEEEDLRLQTGGGSPSAGRRSSPWSSPVSLQAA